MPSTNTLKLIRSLEQKKFRQEHGLFVVEGKKSISELVNSDFIRIRNLYLTQNQEIDFSIPADVTTEYISLKDLSRMSLMTSPDFGLAVAEIPDTTFIPELKDTDFFPVLDSIRDPGNLGTIIRLCDWFGIQSIICSDDTVDVYSPKVIQASMGSFCRVKVHYTGLSDWLKQLSPRIAVYGTTLIGKPLHEVVPKKPSVIVFGNESHGISQKVQDIINHQITIPASPLSKTESLNAAMATSIILWHFFSCR